MNSWRPGLLLLALIALLAGCAGQQQLVHEETRLVALAGPPPAPAPWPAFLLPGWQQPHNRIGQVRARPLRGGRERIYVDGARPLIYHATMPFATARGRYVNQVYRVHFPAIPFSLVPFHLSAGRNVGLLVVITFDEQQLPLLVTTVNGCGCYVAIIPTNFLPAAAYPPDWPALSQEVYGETLPARLTFGPGHGRLLVTVRPETHRVQALAGTTAADLASFFLVAARLQPLASLTRLPLGPAGETSFYYQSWPLRGHVKGGVKIWESLLLGLISLDGLVGMDKEYGGSGANPFYTSLKPWNRHASDMNDFPRFLIFHGWRL
ncbi:MAG: hypothetical protein ABFR97_10085 [Thermodesulfobacteriota bacterium]